MLLEPCRKESQEDFSGCRESLGEPPGNQQNHLLIFQKTLPPPRFLSPCIFLDFPEPSFCKESPADTSVSPKSGLLLPFSSAEGLDWNTEGCKMPGAGWTGPEIASGFALFPLCSWGRIDEGRIWLLVSRGWPFQREVQTCKHTEKCQDKLGSQCQVASSLRPEASIEKRRVAW